MSSRRNPPPEFRRLRSFSGWAESTFWVPTVGAVNELIVETDYSDLATFQRRSEAFFADPEAMTLFRSLNEHVVERSAHDELHETAPRLA